MEKYEFPVSPTLSTFIWFLHCLEMTSVCVKRLLPKQFSSAGEPWRVCAVRTVFLEAAERWKPLLNQGRGDHCVYV